MFTFLVVTTHVISLRKEGLFLAHGSRGTQTTTVVKVWWQEWEVTGHSVAAVRKQSEDRKVGPCQKT